MPNLTVHPIGNSAVILDEARQSLYALDRRSAFLWSCLTDGCTDAALNHLFAQEFDLTLAEAEDETARIIENLEALGLLADRRPNETVSPTHVQPRNKPGVPLANEEHICRIGLLDTVFQIGFPSDSLLRRFQTVMGHLQIGSEPTDCHISLRKQGDGYAIIVDGIEAEACDDADQLAPQLMSIVSAEAVNRAEFGACLHAALLLVDDRAVLIPGPSGTGKSCLALTLANAGLACLSDEKALLDPETFELRGVPLAGCIKDGAWQAMTALYPALSEAMVHMRGDGKRVKYLAMTSPELAGRSWPADHIVFPVYREGIAPGHTRLDPADALGRLLASCMAWRVQLTPAFVRTLIAWIERIDCHEMRYGSHKDALVQFSQLFGQAVLLDSVQGAVRTVR